MKRIAVSLMLFCLLFAALGSAAAQEAAEGGDYYVTGTNPDGTPYTGGLEILRLGAETYQVSWQLGVPAYGIGLVNGNVFGVVVGGMDCALSLYSITETGLDGKWTGFGGMEAYPEMATVVDEANGLLEYSGTNPDGTPYTGQMTLTPTEGGQVIGVQQTSADTSISGTGIQAGGVLAVGFGSENCTLATYVVGEDGSLTGIWVPVGGTVVGGETAQPINIAGAHNVSGVSPDGTAYEGTLEVTADNQVHTFTWTIGDTVSTGVGIMRGASVVIGFGGETCAAVSYFQQASDRTLSGLWSLVGSNQLGGEYAVPTTELVGDDPYVGTYDIVGTNMGNVGDTSQEVYIGTLEIINHDQVYELIWTLENATVYGVGIAANGALAVGYGGESCGVSSYIVNPTDMTGVWALYGVDTLGTEVATR